MKRRCSLFMGGIALASVLLGCASPQAPPDTVLRDRATLCLSRAIRFPGSPTVRAQAVEAAAEALGQDSKLFIRDALQDEHFVVRFAACVALGQIGDPSRISAVRPLLSDPDPNVKISAYFAMERMGDASHRRAWINLVRRHEDPTVRRNGVMLLGQLGDKHVIPLLESIAAKDKDEGVQLQALEARALLGDDDAISRFIHDAYGGMGYRQPFALLALGRVASDRVLPELRTRLNHAPYIEARLAAARSLAMHGDPSGYDLALRALNWQQPEQNLPDDPPEIQIMRVQTMAAMALGNIADRRALGRLWARMESSDDPRVQLAAARSILMILKATDSGGVAGPSVLAAESSRR